MPKVAVLVWVTPKVVESQEIDASSILEYNFVKPGQRMAA